MPANLKKVPVNKFPPRLTPSVRRLAEAFSQKEGVSLNQFINVAVAEKLAHLQHEYVSSPAQSDESLHREGPPDSGPSNRPRSEGNR